VGDSADKNFLQRAVAFFKDAAKWVTDQLSDDAVRNAIYADLGLKPPSGDPAFPDLNEHFDSIDAYRQKEKPDDQALQAAVEDLKAIRQGIRDFVHATQGGGIPDETFDALIRLMSTNFLRMRLPIVYWIAQPIGLVGDAMSIGAIPKAAGTGTIDFIKDPIQHFKNLFPSLDTEDHAFVISSAVLAPVSIALGLFHKKLAPKSDFAILYGWEPDIGSTTPVGDRISKRTMSVSITKAADVATATVGGTILASVALVPTPDGGPGVLLSLGGAAELAKEVDGWVFKIKLGSASAFSLLVTGWDSARSASGPAGASVELSAGRKPDPSGLPFRFDLGSRVRLEFGDLLFSTGFDSTGPKLRLATGKSAFIVEPKSDVVLERGTPSGTDLFRLDFELALGLANGKFFIEGGSGLQVTLPVTKKLGPLQARGLTLGLVPSTDPAQPPLSFEATATILVTLGPFTLTIDRIGLAASLSRDFDPAASFHPPNGIGVVIQSEVVSGGGYIFFDSKAHQYAGVLALSIKDKISLKAIGILNTRIDDKPAFSFLIIITATGFTPIELGLGFKLTGIGGLLGLDREARLDALESGIKNHTLDRILFPPDPVANSAEIVTAASAVFPPKRGQTIFGPMVQIAWGASQLIHLDLAIIIQVPSVRLVILGKLRADFPNPKLPVVKIHIDLVGDIDFDRKRIFAQASLIESTIAGFTLAGDAAMLLYWGDDSTYIISFGGFNPHYQKQVPAEFPKLARLSVGLTQRENLTAKLEVYCAITSNSFQIGGSLSVVAKKSKFSVEGSLSVDALFQSGEPSFIFDISGKIQLKAFGQNLFMVKIEGSLSGTHPWHITGKVTFSIWIFDYSINVDHTWGDEQPTPQLPPVDVGPILRAELADARNWTAELPTAAQSLVTLKPGNAGEVVLHPLGTLTVAQRVAPLGVNLSRFGESKPQGQTLFSIDTVTIGTSTAPFANVQEPFARAQFVEMSQDEKLSAPAFEKLNSGVRIGGGALTGGPVVEASNDYTTLIWDPVLMKAVPDAPYTMPSALVLALAATSPAGRAASARSNGARFRGPSRPVQVTSIKYVVASTEDQSTAAGVTPGSYTNTVAALKTQIAANPQQRGKLQVLPVAG
jgi:hypothetical protein